MRYLLLLALLLPATATRAQSHDHDTHNARETAEHATPADTAAVVAAAEAFRTAIVDGDADALKAIVLPEALILESGGVETRSEYLGHHFGSDGAFLNAMAREPKHRTITVSGHTAWVASTSRLHGCYRDRDIDVSSAELLVLRWVDGAWRVAAVHWSSR